MATLFEMGLGKNLYRTVLQDDGMQSIKASSLNPSVSIPPGGDFSGEFPSEGFISGEIYGNLIMAGGAIGSKNFVSGSAGWQLTPTSAEINVGTALGFLDIPDRSTTNSFHVESDGDTFWGANNVDFTADPNNAKAFVLKTGVAKFQDIALSGSVTIKDIKNDTTTDISLMEMSHNIVFSVTDADTIAWSSGTINMSNGRQFAIDAGNTGNMAALTYIYIDPDTSSTVLQTTTTYSTAIGADKRLLGTAQNQTTTASFIPYGPGEPLIDGDNIGALSIVTGNLAASSVIASKISVTDLAAINANLGTITAGTIQADIILVGTTAINIEAQRDFMSHLTNTLPTVDGNNDDAIQTTSKPENNTSFVYICFNIGTVLTIKRFSITDGGTYVLDGKSATVAGSAITGIVHFGSNVFVSHVASGPVEKLTRFAEDLTGSTVITFSGTVTAGHMATDATSIYICGNYLSGNATNDTIVYRYTISGTTATFQDSTSYGAAARAKIGFWGDASNNYYLSAAGTLTKHNWAGTLQGTASNTVTSGSINIDRTCGIVLMGSKRAALSFLAIPQSGTSTNVSVKLVGTIIADV